MQLVGLAALVRAPFQSYVDAPHALWLHFSVQAHAHAVFRRRALDHRASPQIERVRLQAVQYDARADGVERLHDFGLHLAAGLARAGQPRDERPAVAGEDAAQRQYGRRQVQ